jgi:hypothetical protein
LKQHKKGDRGRIKKRIVLKREQGNKEIIQSVRGEMARLVCSIAFMHFALIHFCTYAFLHLCIFASLHFVSLQFSIFAFETVQTGVGGRIKGGKVLKKVQGNK